MFSDAHCLQKSIANVLCLRRDAGGMARPRLFRRGIAAAQRLLWNPFPILAELLSNWESAVCALDTASYSFLYKRK